MTYDFHGAWDAKTNHQSALFDSPNDPSTGDQKLYNSNDAIEAFISRGVPAAKLNLGIGYYGRGWTGVANANNGLYQTASGAAPGTYEAGIEDWKVLKNWRGRATPTTPPVPPDLQRQHAVELRHPGQHHPQDGLREDPGPGRRVRLGVQR